MRTRRKLERVVRNGKAVYVPQSTPSPQRSRNRSGDHPPRRAGIRLVRLLLLGSFSVVVGLLWLSIQYLSNPDVAFWLDYGLLGLFHPHRITSGQPLRLSNIQAAIGAEQLYGGQPIVLKYDATMEFGIGTATDIAIPVLSAIDGTTAGACPQACSIQQLRIYRALDLPWVVRVFQRDPYFRLTDTVAVHGPTESDLRALDNNPLLSLGSDRSMPMTQAELYDPAPQPGSWLRLVGLQTQGNSVSTYGQVYYFNPREEKLELMLNWVSPLGEVPQWQQVTGDHQPELVINQTVGLEPQYKVYQFRLADGVAQDLQPILLNDPAFDSRDYSNALALARSGLWTPAKVLLTQVKQNNPKRWNPTAQNQLDLIQLYAKITQAQAIQSSASSVQRIMGYLINGSWRAALDVFQSDRSLRPELREMLLSDSGHLTSRIDTALRVTPGDENIIAWGALLKLSRGSHESAIAWTQQQANGSAAIVSKVQKILKQMEQPIPTPLKLNPASKKPKSGSVNPSSVLESSPSPTVVTPNAAVDSTSFPGVAPIPIPTSSASPSPTEYASPSSASPLP